MQNLVRSVSSPPKQRSRRQRIRPRSSVSFRGEGSDHNTPLSSYSHDAKIEYLKYDIASVEATPGIVNMTNSTPVYCFTIPSVSDGTILDCRIYHPVSLRDALSTEQRTKKAAIFAHPYAPLGGSMDDAVVTTIVDELVDLDFVVGTFNFRGAASSQGTTSWTGKTERDDYISVAGHLLFYLHLLQKPNTGQGDTSRSHSLAGSTESMSPEYITLVLGGYSYGSLIVTHLPSTADILAIFRQPRPSNSASEVLLRAKELALQTNVLSCNQTEARGRLSSQPLRSGHQRQSSSQHSIVYGGSDSPSPVDRHSLDFVHKSMEVPARIKHAIYRSHKHAETSAPASPSTSSHGSTSHDSDRTAESLPHVLTHYLLISPLLPPLSSILSLSTSSLLFWRHSANRTENLARNPTLVVFGTQDIFTSSHKLNMWCKKMVSLSSQAAGSSGHSSFRWKKVKGAGHFWRERGVEAQLTASLRAWVHEVVVHEQQREQ